MLLAIFPIYQLVRKNIKGGIAVYTTLFIVGLVIFGYVFYVLIKPEKF